MSLLDLELAAGRDLGRLLRHGQREDAVFVLGLDAVDVDAGDVEAAGEGAVEAFALDEVLLLVLFLLLALVLGADGQAVVLNVDLDVVLVEAGQLRLQLEGVAGVDHVGAEGRDHAPRVAEEAALELVELTEGIHGGEMTDMTIERNDFKHDDYLLNPYTWSFWPRDLFLSSVSVYKVPNIF